MRTLPAILTFFLFVFRFVLGLTIDFYGYIRTADRAKSASCALDFIGIGGHRFLEAGWIIPFGVQSVGNFYLLFRANGYAQSATFAPFLIDFNAAFHCYSPLLA
jgi:hypothetical protein